MKQKINSIQNYPNSGLIIPKYWLVLELKIITMMKFLTYSFLVVLNFVFFSLSGQTWLGNSNDWNNTSNWDNTMIPTATDNVVIPATANNPLISGSVPNVASIDIGVGAQLTIGSGGSITVEQENGNGKGVQIDNGTLIVRGTLNIHPIGGETINGIGVAGNIEVYGTISLSEISGGDIEMCIENDISNPSAASVTIHVGGLIIATDVENELFEFEDGNDVASSITNNGTLRYINGNDEMMRLGDGDTFINNGLIEAMRSDNSEDEAIELNENDVFTNNGIIRIDNYNMGIDLEQSGSIFTNNGRIEITNTNSESITVNTGSTFINSNDPNAAILLDYTLNIDGTFTNNGYMLLGNGDLDVEGTFTNSVTGYICDPNDLVANPIGAGIVNDNGTTETGVCLPAPPPPGSAQIPTLGQWGLIVLGMAFFSIGLVGIRNKKWALA